MNKTFSIIFIIFVLILRTHLSNTVLLIQIFRHGARWPEKDIFKNEEVAYNLGELVPQGMRQHYNLGRVTKELYPNLFSNEYNPGKLKILTIKKNRCSESAKSLVYGLYDLRSAPKLNTNIDEFMIPPYATKNNQPNDDYGLPLGYNPIAIFTSDTEINSPFVQDNWIDTNCPNANGINNNDFNKIINELNTYCLPLSNILKQVPDNYYNPKEIFNHKDFSCEDLHYFYDTQRSHYFQYGVYLWGIDKQIYNKLNVAANIYLYNKWYNIFVRKLHTNNIFRLVINEQENKVNNRDYQVTYVGLSGTDHTIGPIQTGSKVMNWDCLVEQLKNESEGGDSKCIYEVPLASNINFELNQVNEIYLVRSIYNGNIILIDCNTDQIYYRVLGRKGQYNDGCTIQEFKAIAISLFLYDANEFGEICLK